ncbi:hypothetical protein EJ04DRAFT_173934 [Polyplosphaeria fusca]|uniref:Uncharacterized protein n=1 Tax=Polyplosphaeria fusca TaxID=682080 RepID=A0A9P4USE6_9PLEO|nr:hypothetical protein EJ04DRAFT_173934 [Polyplosphaeria fusca]
MNKVFSKADGMLAEAAKKFTSVSVNRGKTAFPKAPKDLESLGIRWDFDGEVTQGEQVYNKFQIQPNAGKIPSSIKDWREKNGGTHAVMGTMYVKKGGSKGDVQEAFEKFKKEFKD